MSRYSSRLSVIVAFCLAGSPSLAVAQQDPLSNVPVVVTNGEGIVTAAPDRAFVVVTAESRAKQPRDAQRQNAEAMNAVQEKLRAARVPKEAIRTTSFTLQQEFDYVNGKQVPRGFVARHAIEVRIDEIARVGEIIDAAVTSGATSVSQIRFDLKDRAGTEREALRLAVADARARAEAAAAGAGRSIERVLKIQETRDTLPRPIPMPMTTAARVGLEQAPTPVAQGEIEIRAFVTLTASIR